MVIGLTVLSVYEFIKFWLPLAAFFSLFVKGLLSIKKWLNGWNKALVDIKDAAYETARSIGNLVAFTRDLATNQTLLVGTLSTMRQDLHEHVLDDERIQTQLLTNAQVVEAKIDVNLAGIESIKDKQILILTSLADLKVVLGRD